MWLDDLAFTFARLIYTGLLFYKEVVYFYVN